MTEAEAQKWLKSHLTGPINGGAAETCAKAVGGRLAALVNGAYKKGIDAGKLSPKSSPHKDWGRVDG